MDIELGADKEDGRGVSADLVGLRSLSVGSTNLSSSKLFLLMVNTLGDSQLSR